MEGLKKLKLSQEEEMFGKASANKKLGQTEAAKEDALGKAGAGKRQLVPRDSLHWCQERLKEELAKAKEEEEEEKEKAATKDKANKMDLEKSKEEAKEDSSSKGLEKPKEESTKQEGLEKPVVIVDWNQTLANDDKECMQWGLKVYPIETAYQKHAWNGGFSFATFADAVDKFCSLHPDL
eukprot:s125_g43.t1